MKKTLDGGTLIGIGAVAALLLVNSVLTFRNMRQLDEDARWVAQTHDVLDCTNDVLLTIIDAETGQRGYLITKREDYLVPYHAARAHWEENMALLKAKTSENRHHQDRIKQLESMSSAEFDLLQQGIDMRRKNAKIPQLFDSANAAKKQMDSIRQVVTEMRVEEQKLLEERRERTASAYRSAIFMEVLTTVIGFIVLGGFVAILQRNLRIRAKTAAAIQEQREWLSTTLSSIGDGVISTDTDGNVTLINVVAQALTGWSMSEAKGKPLDSVFRIINEKTRQPAENPVKRVLQSGAIVGLANHTLLIAKDGTERAIDDSAAPIRSDDGRTIGVVMVFRDVTERRRSMETIRKGELRLRMALSAARMMIWEWNPALNQIVISESFGDILGLKPTASIHSAEQLFGLIHPNDLQRHKAVLQKAIDASESYVSQFRVIRQDSGETVWLEERGHTICDASGKTERVIGLVIDINERKRTEEVLKDADQRKNEFLALLAHELRNPLAPIRNALQIMRLGSGNDKSLVPVRDMMERQVGHLNRLVDDLLDVSRITRGSLELRRARVAISEAVDNGLEAIRPLLEAAKHELTVNIPAQPLWVDGDLTRLAQVVSNLLSNAVKYTPEGGKIWLTVERQNDDAVLSVRDNGIGIPPEMLSHVFEMFTQVDRAVERIQGGLGIGLTLVRRLVQMHGGTVDVLSAGPGHGSEFIVRLPLAGPNLPLKTPVESDEPSSPSPEKPRRRILVVDDNVDSAESLGLLLKIMGNEVHTAHDGQNALQVAQEFHPDIVLLDIGLPGMSGYEVARRMKSMPAMKNTLLVAQTGWGQEDDRRRSMEAGFDAHLVKPLDQAALHDLLAR